MPFGKCPKSIDEAITNAYSGYCFKGEGNISLQLTTSKDVIGVGVKIDCKSKVIKLKKEMKDNIILKWEGDMFDQRADAVSNSYKGAEVVEVNNMYFAPKRTGAQLVSCAQLNGSLEELLDMRSMFKGIFRIQDTDANCAYEIIDDWPCLVAIKNLKPNEELKWLYNTDISSELFRNYILEWSIAKKRKELAKKKAKEGAFMRMREKTKRNVDETSKKMSKRSRDSNGRYCKHIS